MKVPVTDEDRKTAHDQIEARIKEYAREIEDCHEQGYGVHYCFHGTNLWTDYDPICGYCEDGAFDPRRHHIGSPEYRALVEEVAGQAARDRAFNFLLELIREDAKDASNRTDLERLKAHVNIALELE